MTPEAMPRDEWAEDDGPALWWFFPVCEPPYSGSPLDDDFPAYVTHWTRIIIPKEPAVTGFSWSKATSAAIELEHALRKAAVDRELMSSTTPVEVTECPTCGAERIADEEPTDD